MCRGMPAGYVEWRGVCGRSQSLGSSVMCSAISVNETHDSFSTNEKTISHLGIPIALLSDRHHFQTSLAVSTTSCNFAHC
jgi:hypothetical protein